MDSLVTKIFLTAFFSFIIPFFSFSQEEKNTLFKDTTTQPADTIQTVDTTQTVNTADTADANKNSAQTQKKYHRVDTVYLFEGKPMVLNVLKITYNSLIYTEPGKTELKKMNKSKVHKVKHNWGRLEVLNEQKSNYNKRYDWRKVKIIEKRSEAEGLIKVEKITAKAEGSSRGYETPRSLETKATIILKKKAANLNAKYVLITNKAMTIAFGEIPAATLTGIAYTDEEISDKSGEKE